MCSSKAANRGFTLVEMMVAITIGLFIGVAVLAAQAQLFRESAVLSALSVRQTEGRVALDLLSRDLASAGFGQGWGATQCDLTVAYAHGQAQAFPAVSSVAAQASTAVPLTTLSAGYPVAGSAVASDMLLLSTSTAMAQQTLGQSFQVTQFGTTQSSQGQGAVQSTLLPLPQAAQDDSSLREGNTVQVRVQLDGRQVCYVVPVTALTPTAKALYLSSKGAGMPSNGYAGDDAALAQAGLTSSISDAALLNATVTDLGAGAVSNVLTAYYVGWEGQVPALWRAQVNVQDGAVLAAQPIALGVVSLQTRFLVGSTPQTWAQVVAAGQQAQVRAVQFALVVRTLQPDYGYAAPAVLAVPGFTAYPVPSQDRHDHYTVLTSQVTLRNVLWPAST